MGTRVAYRLRSSGKFVSREFARRYPDEVFKQIVHERAYDGKSDPASYQAGYQAGYRAGYKAGRKSAKVRTFGSGERFLLKHKTIKFICCDCNLVHAHRITHRNGKTYLTLWRDNGSTAARRRWHGIPVLKEKK